MTYLHVSRGKGLNIQFSRAGEMRSQRLEVCGSGKSIGGKEGWGQELTDSQGARGEKQKLGSEKKISYFLKK